MATNQILNQLRYLRPINPRVKLAYLLRDRAIVTSDEGFLVTCSPILLTAEGHLYAGQLILDCMRQNFPDAKSVAGARVGGQALMHAVSCVSTSTRPLDAIYIDVEKKLLHGMPDSRSGVVILQDSSGPVDAEVKLLKSGGYKVMGVISLINSGAPTNGLSQFSVFTKEQIYEEIAEWEVNQKPAVVPGDKTK